MRVTISCEIEFTPNEDKQPLDAQKVIEMWFKDQVGIYHQITDEQDVVGVLYVDEDPATWNVRVGS